MHFSSGAPQSEVGARGADRRRRITLIRCVVQISAPPYLEYNVCATIVGVRKGAPFSGTLYYLYNRRRQFLRHYTSCTKGDAVLRPTIPRVHKGAPISVPLYLIYIRGCRFMHHYTSCRLYSVLQWRRNRCLLLYT